MLFSRYIFDFFHYHFSGKYYCKENYYINFLQESFPTYRNISQYVNKDIKLSEWINSFVKFQKITVLGSGASLNKLTILSKDNLYIAANSAVCKVLNYHFIFFSFTRTYINAYLRNGFKQKGWEGTIFRFTKNKLNHKNRMKSYQNILKYKRKRDERNLKIILTITKGIPKKETLIKLINLLNKISILIFKTKITA